jgi:hypothetical protein
MDCHTDCYVAALGHMPQDRRISGVMQVGPAHRSLPFSCAIRSSPGVPRASPPTRPARMLNFQDASVLPWNVIHKWLLLCRHALAQVKVMLDLARAMLAAVDGLPYPDTLGKMQIRIGLHVGSVYGGVIGVKYPRYSLFGGTLRLAQGLQVRWRSAALNGLAALLTCTALLARKPPGCVWPSGALHVGCVLAPGPRLLPSASPEPEPHLPLVTPPPPLRPRRCPTRCT